MNRKNIDIIDFIENTLNCKLYSYQKEIVRNIYNKTGVVPNLIIPRRRIK